MKKILFAATFTLLAVTPIVTFATVGINGTTVVSPWYLEAYQAGSGWGASALQQQFNDEGACANFVGLVHGTTNDPAIRCKNAITDVIVCVDFGEACKSTPPATTQNNNTNSQNNGNTNNTNTAGNNTNNAANNSGGSNNEAAGEFVNPIRANTFGKLVVGVANLVTQIAVPIVVIFLMYAGFLFVSARGNQQQLTKAKETFYWTIVGALIVVGANFFARATVNFAQSLGSGSQNSEENTAP
jgi:hypothetical protein